MKTDIFSDDFKGVLEYCFENDLYLGEGNPNAKILIVGQEIGYGLEKKGNKNPNLNEVLDKSKKINTDNLTYWKSRYETNSLFFEYLDFMQNEFKRVPNRTWGNYQKIISNVVFDRTINDNHYDFLDHCFITEYSQLSLPSPNYNFNKNKEEIKEFKELKINSVNKRKPLFSTPFFQSFPIVIMACGHYPTKYFPMDIQKKFDVEFDGKTKTLSMGNYYNLHTSSNKILIHTRQFSCGVSNDLIKQIATECKSYYK